MINLIESNFPLQQKLLKFHLILEVGQNLSHVKKRLQFVIFSRKESSEKSEIELNILRLKVEILSSEKKKNPKYSLE